MPRINFIFIFVLFVVTLCGIGSGREVSMKVVDEPSSFGYPNQEQDTSNELKMRIQPSNFSGPPHLRQLNGKCFTKIDDSYKYEFCPFTNLTQHEQSLRWNPYSGVLGVWQEWEIVNNTFTAMMMGEGDACGSKQRQTKVLLECGDENVVDKVTEPSTCQYQVVFKTPLVCHPHAMLVYPTLNQTLRHEWDLLEGQYENQEFTLKGYNKALHRLFEAAGYVLPESEKKAIAKEAMEKEQREHKQEAGNFDTLDQCSEEYKKLKDEIAGLRSLLAVYQGTNGTDVKHMGREKDPLYDDYSDHMDHDLEMEHYRYHGDY